MIGFQTYRDAARLIRAAKHAERLRIQDTRRLSNRRTAVVGHRWLPFKNTLRRDLPPHSLVRLVDEEPTVQTIPTGGGNDQILAYSVEDAGVNGYLWRDGVTDARTVKDGELGWMTLEFPARVRLRTEYAYPPPKPRIGQTFGPWFPSTSSPTDNRLPCLQYGIPGFRVIGDTEVIFDESSGFYYATVERENFPIFRGKTVDGIIAGEEGYVAVYNDDDEAVDNVFNDGPEFRITAKNNFADLGNGKWAVCTLIGETWHITAGEC